MKKFVKIWFLLSSSHEQALPSGIKFFSAKYQREYDCDEELIRSLYRSLYSNKMGYGLSVYSSNSSTEWEPIEPGSIDNDIWKIACRKQLPSPNSVNTLPPVAPDWASPEWMKYGDNDRKEYLFHFDPTSIRKNEQFRTVWSLWSDKSRSSEKLYPIRRVLYEFHCGKELVKVAADNEHTNARSEGLGNILHHLAFRPLGEELEWGLVKNLGFRDVDILYNIVCNK